MTRRYWSREEVAREGATRDYRGGDGNSIADGETNSRRLRSPTDSSFKGLEVRPPRVDGYLAAGCQPCRVPARVFIAGDREGRDSHPQEGWGDRAWRDSRRRRDHGRDYHRATRKPQALIW